MTSLKSRLALLGVEVPDAPFTLTWHCKALNGYEFHEERSYARALEAACAQLAGEVERLRKCDSCDGKGEIDMVTGWKDNGPNEPIEIVEPGTCPGCSGTGRRP